MGEMTRVNMNFVLSLNLDYKKVLFWIFFVLPNTCMSNEHASEKLDVKQISTQFHYVEAQAPRVRGPMMVVSKWSAGSELEVGAGGGTGGAHYDG